MKELNKKLVNEYLNTGSEEVLTKIVQENEKLIYKCAHDLSDSLNEVEDLFQEGVIGLIKGLDSYEPDKMDGNPSTYLYYHIRNVMNRRKFHSKLKVPSYSGHLYSKVGKSGKESVSRVSQETLELLLNTRGMDMIFLDAEDGEMGRENHEYFAKESRGIKVIESELFVSQILDTIGDVLERYVIEEHVINMRTLASVGKDINMSKQMVYKIKKKCLKKLRRLNKQYEI